MRSKLQGFFLLCISALIGITACKNSGKVTLKSAPIDKLAVGLSTIMDTSSVFSSNLTGFALYNPDTDSLIHGKNENRYFTPASNIKLLTFFTGLKLLPDSLRALEYIVQGDSVIFWGTGDPSFLHPDLASEKVYNFLKSRNEKLYYSDSNFDDEYLGPGWSWSDYNYYYQTEKTPLPMFGNVVQFEIEEIQIKKIASENGTLKISPPFFHSFLSENQKRGESLLFRELDGNQILYAPERDTSSYTLNKPFHYTPKLITDLLSDTLNKPVKYLPDAKKPDSLYAIYSIPTDTAFKYMLQPSDNFIAEQLLLVSASEKGMKLNSGSIIDLMESDYLNFLPHQPQWVDGSGLSRYNMVTPKSMVYLLKEIDEEFNEFGTLSELLPAGGKRGTIKNWYAARDDSSAYVYAKTGTLSNNHSLSGYIITESGKKLIFSIMNNHYITSSSLVKEEMEKLLWFIHKEF